MNRKLTIDLHDLALRIKTWGEELGFGKIAITDLPGEPAGQAEQYLLDWLHQGFHGEMEYLARYARLRARPEELVPGCVRVIMARMDYLPQSLPADNAQWAADSWQNLSQATHASVAWYAHGRDYHKVVRGRLQQLAERIQDVVGPLGYRVFSDSAPVMEVELAQRAGLGWRGKHTLLLSRQAGSMFFLGEIFIDLPLPIDRPLSAHCGRCSACINVCPTRAIVAPYRLDARRCIAYLTIELKGSIPVELRPLIGNRIYGCDDCQLVCPWNKYAQRARLADFDERGWDTLTLIEVFAWSEAEFLQRSQGTAMRRIGHERWLRNVAVALGNALARDLTTAQRQAIRASLGSRVNNASPLVQEHIAWALSVDLKRAQ